MTALTTRGALAAEWIKLRTVRSTYLTLLLAAAVSVLVGTLDAASAAHAWDSWAPERRATFDPVRYGFSGGFYIAVLAVGVLGVLSASAEYGTGLIRTTVTATPRRRQVFTAKVCTVGVLALAVGQLLAFTTYFLGQAQLAGHHLDVGLGAPRVLRAVLETGLFFAVLALVGLALGFLVRRSAGAVALLFGLFFVLPPLLGTVSDRASQWTLQGAFESMTSTVTTANHAPSATALPACALYPAVLLGAAALLVRRRDV
ncbi:ABC transporter permease [Kitasatospora sp. NPDC092948]|uniref:ABC transporter permease n=1 Tax=Kitasatospora sp. NPDC092948 TaxID=3364088 RepID=UPI00380EDA93